eukprot:1026800-Prorocentrum_lima.AAC.1
MDLGVRHIAHMTMLMELLLSFLTHGMSIPQVHWMRCHRRLASLVWMPAAGFPQLAPPRAKSKHRGACLSPLRSPLGSFSPSRHES